MTGVDVNRAHDLVARLAGFDELLAPANVTSAEVDRFIDAWAEAVHAMPIAQRPVGLVFALGEAPKDAPLPGRDRVAEVVHNLITRQREGEIGGIRLDGTELKDWLKPDPQLRRQLTGGYQWTADLASQLSAGGFRSICVCLATGTAFSTFVDGSLVHMYVDARNRALESAADLRRRQGWGDGELLVRCGEENLIDRGRLGVWACPDHYVLRNRPEELMQERLKQFLQTHLVGFEELTVEYELPPEGRVDLRITIADRSSYLVEIKWVGRSIKREHGGLSAKEVEELVKGKGWKCDPVMVLDEDNAKKGIEQLARYLGQGEVRRGYLVVFDCRRPPDAKGRGAESGYPAASGLQPHHYRVFHVQVNPVTASHRN